MFLESRLNSTQDCNLVGRLGGREENHLATIAAAVAGRIWNSHRKGGKRRKKKRGDGKKYERTHSTVHRVSGLRREAHVAIQNTGNVVVVVVVFPQLYYSRKIEKQRNREKGNTSPFYRRAGYSTANLRARCNFACKSDS